ncbi:MAG: hypothetical protein U0L26_12710 [Cellulosilyticum sp.]|nr:hypothetical protein [Cellulosilyticum sp.]
MSRVVIYGEDGDVEAEVLYSREECRYKVNGKCYNNGSLEHLGKVCHNICNFYMKENWKG